MHRACVSTSPLKRIRTQTRTGRTRPAEPVRPLDLLVVREVHERVEFLQCVELYDVDAYNVNNPPTGLKTTPSGQATVN